MNVNLRHFFFTVQSVKKSMIDNGGGQSLIWAQHHGW